MASETTKHPPGTTPREADDAPGTPASPNGGGSVLRPVGQGTRERGRVGPAPGTGGAPNGSDGRGGGNGFGGQIGGIPSFPPPGRSPKPKIKKLRILFIAIGLGVLGLASAFFGMVMAVSQDLPAIEEYAQFKAAKNTEVTDSQGEVIGTLSSNQNRILIPPESISPNMKNAVVAIEDSRFYEHRGIDFQGLGRALVQDIVTQSASQGASTITQQLVKQALEAQNSRTVFQKVREMSLAYHIEQQWTKDKILTEYLNTVYFGSGAYGVESAARTYFGDAHPTCGTLEEPCAELLTPSEAALLAGMIQNPYGYDPESSAEAALARRNLVLQKMLEQGYISEEQYQEGTAEPLPSSEEITPPKLDSKAPYFTSWVRQQLVDRFGAGRTFFGGLKVKTTLDLEVQAAAEEAVTSTLGGIGPTASVVIINNDDATIDAMVAGPDFESAPFNLAVQGQRQPGSTIKPFVLTTALDQGISPATVYESAPQLFRFGKKGKQLFPVKNYGDSYLGSASLATATTYSDNSVYAQVGLESIDGGPKSIAATIHKMGVREKIQTNPAMVLGTSVVSPYEWTYAFTTLANDGRRVSGTLAPVPGDSPVAYTKVTGEDGNPIRGGENQVMSTEVISPEVAQTAKDILGTVVTSGTGKNAYIGDDSQWGKTGTTDNNGDAWFCGAITEVTACVWVGYPDGITSMETEYGGAPVDGGTFPAIIWARVIEAWKSIEATRVAEQKAKDAAKGTTDEDTGSGGD
ncbi:MAG: transglycosylase domain-containing protein, partial [Solirubrobacterales bacterium]|nr:transglycosylase domain-containing protein [Solirubrobacterales bacterium]